MKKFDERQQAEENRIGKNSFYTMFFTCAAVIVWELIRKGNFESVLGETIVFLAGGAACLTGSIKAGLWTKTGGKMSAVQRLLLSGLLAGVFTVLYVAALSRKAGGEIAAAKPAAGFFTGVFLLGFLVLTMMGRLAEKKQKEQDEKYCE